MARYPIAAAIRRQQARIAKLDERIGALMSERVSEEEVLAELHKMAANPAALTAAPEE
jgi:hypothetical protein